MLRVGFFILLVFGAVFGTVTARAADDLSRSLPAAVTLTQGDVEAAVAKALVDKGAGDAVRAVILGGKTGQYYEGTEHVSPLVTGLTFDKQTSRFSANLMLVTEDKVLSAAPISGRYQQTVSLPVLKRQMRSGEQITQSDLDYMEFPLARTRSDAVTDTVQLIGQTPRGTISQNRPIRLSELSAPAAVKKNALVVMRYKSPSMEISTSGQALTNGATGDIIEVRNLISRQIVRAVVDNATTVSVTPLSDAPKRAGELHADAR